MSIDEQPRLLSCEGQSMLAIVAMPEGGRPTTGLLIVVGGPQYRAGSHRQFVQLARAIAAAGFATLRFDVRGMGDSMGDPRSFEQLSPDIGAAIDGLVAAVPSVRSVVLWGLCDGASASLLYLHERRDPRVTGLVLVNPWVRTAQGEAKARVKHYYTARLTDPAFWSKLLSGGVPISAGSGLLRSLWGAVARTPPAAQQPSYTVRMAQAWQSFSGPVLLALSSHDLTAREFELHTHSSPEWRRALRARSPTTIRLEGADHTCSQPEASRQLIQATVDWLVTLSST